MAATIEELKNIIVELKIELARERIPSSHCPYAYYHRENPIGNCSDISCEECKTIFFEDMRKNVEEDVKEL